MIIVDNIYCVLINGKLTLSISVDIINEYLMKGNNADIIYLDFCKAFDMVSHYCWLVKMKMLGILKIVNIVWYFLRDGTMKVKIGKNYSETQNIASSVPQDFCTVTFFLFFSIHKWFILWYKNGNKTICWWCLTIC